MITLSLPSADEQWYSEISSFIVGPYGTDGSAEKGNVITFRSNTDLLAQGKETSHEKNVTHAKIEADLTYNPALSAIVSAPSGSYPYYCTLSGTMPDGAAATLTGQKGLGVGGRVVISLISGRYHYTIFDGDNAHFKVYNAVPDNSTTFSNVSGWTISYHEYTFLYVKGNSVFWTRKSGNIPVGRPRNYISSWADLSDYGKYMAMISKAPAPVLPSPTIVSARAVRSNKNASFSVSASKTRIETQVKYLIEENAPSVTQIHYGELAQMASQKVYANQVNMVAFLKDLRNPKEMIPKLKRLTELKTHASNHLAIQYGILPTVSDLQKIVAAFKRVKPYLDQNGYEVYTASHFDSSTNGVYTTELEQRLKIAIANEDSGFTELGNAVESAGFALTLENVWDLIPYSFIVDWFIGVGDFLERCDTRMRIMRLNIRYATMSRKTTKSVALIPDASFPVSGTVKLVRYKRWTDKHCPEPPLFLQNTSASAANHWLEASALFIQRAK